MKITKRQLRKILKEAIDVLNTDTGEVLEFGDDPDALAPDAAVEEIIRRLGIKAIADPDGYSVGDDDFEILQDEILGKRRTRKRKKDRARMNIDNLMTRLEDWAVNAGEEYAADNPDADLQGVAWDLAQGAEYSFEPDEWNALLYTGPFEGEDDLYTYIADLIAQEIKCKLQQKSLEES